LKERAMLPELSSERLLLRELSHADGPAVQAIQARPEYWRLQAVEPETPEDGVGRVDGYLKHRGPPARQRIMV
jgi:hypothetical protein